MPMPQSNYPMDRSDFRLIRGVQNEIQFFVKDIDRKPAGPSYFASAAINIVDPATDTLLMTRNLTLVDANTARYQLTILPAEMDNWPLGSLRWSLTATRSDNTTVMLWTGQNYSPYSTLQLTEGPTPGPSAPSVFAWADFSQLVNGSYYSSALKGAAQNGFTNGMQTFVCNFDGFTGTIRIDGSLAAQPMNTDASTDWFAVQTETYNDMSGSVSLNVSGNYTWMRMVATPSSGTLTQLQYKV